MKSDDKADKFTRSPSKYFKNYEWNPRQRLMEDLILGAIKQTGMNCKYIPKENFIRDELFGDDTFTKYEKAVTLPVYVKNVDSFEGQGDLFSRFGFQIADTMTITISKKSWLDVQKDDFVPGNGEETRARPLAGDLMWFPVFDKMFEITHVEKEGQFYQFGALYTFDLTLELYKYNQDEFETGFSPVDDISAFFGRDTTGDTVLLEDEEPLTLEDGGLVVSDDFTVEEKDTRADNDFIQDKADDLINHDERAPFIRKDKW